MRNRFQKQRKIDNKIRIFLPVMICGIMVAVLWNSSSQIFRETKKRQEESLKEAVIKGAVNVTVWKGDIQKVFLIWRNIMDWSMTKTSLRSHMRSLGLTACHKLR